MSGFPDNLVEVMHDAVTRVEGVTIGAVFDRYLNKTDPNGAVGIQTEEWIPVDYEMNGRGDFEPTVQNYLFSVQHMVKHADAQEGQRIHREVAKSIRLMLYRDNAVQVALRQLLEWDEVLDRKERFQGLRITAQRFASNDIDGTFVFLSATEVTVQTETT